MIPRPKGHNPALLRFSHALTAAASQSVEQPGPHLQKHY